MENLNKQNSELEEQNKASNVTQEHLPFMRSMLGAERKKKIVQGPDTLNVESVRDESEFECY